MLWAAAWSYASIIFCYLCTLCYMNWYSYVGSLYVWDFCWWIISRIRVSNCLFSVFPPFLSNSNCATLKMFNPVFYYNSSWLMPFFYFVFVIFYQFSYFVYALLRSHFISLLYFSQYSSSISCVLELSLFLIF